MYIYLIRHGESYSNTSKYIKDDDLDLGLTEKGIKQVNYLKLEIGKIKTPYKILSSPYKRAIHTSKILFLDNKIKIVDEFKELNKGFSQGPFKKLTWEEWNDYFNKNENNIIQKKWKYPMGESIQDLENRVIPKFLDIVKENKDNEIIFMVLHNWVIKVILSYILKYDIGYKSIKIKNATMIKINYTSGNFSIII